MNEAEKRLATGIQELGFAEHGAKSKTGTQTKESTNGLESPHELGGELALIAPGQLSGISTGEYARDLGV